MKVNSVQDFYHLVLKSQTPILVDFYADWCAPCKILAKELAKIENKIEVIKINVDEYSELAEQYNVKSIPTLIIFDKGAVIKRVSGYKTQNQLIELIG
jgi:thioredoxin